MGVKTFNLRRDLGHRIISSIHHGETVFQPFKDLEDDFFATPRRLLKKDHHSSFWVQFAAMYWAHLLGKFRDPPLLILSIMGVLLYSLSVAFTYFQIPQAPEYAPTVKWVLLLQTVYSTATSNLATFTTFDKDRQEVLSRGTERDRAHLRFSSAAVWLGRYTAETQLRIIYALLSAAIIYPICGLRPGFNWYLLYQLGLIMQAMGNGAFGLNVAAFISNHLTGAWVATLFFLFNLLFSGSLYVARDVTWILLWLRYLSVSFYVGQILIFSQFYGATYADSPVTGDDILSDRGWLAQPLSVTIVGLILLSLLYNATGILGLWFTTRHAYVDTNK